MRTTSQDRDERQTDTVPSKPPADDTEVHDIFDLWRDLGGSD